MIRVNTCICCTESMNECCFFLKMATKITFALISYFISKIVCNFRQNDSITETINLLFSFSLIYITFGYCWLSIKYKSMCQKAHAIWKYISKIHNAQINSNVGIDKT